MEKKHFLIKLNPPRPSFSQDMTPDEAKILQAHVAYWLDLTAKGTSILFGPVMDPKVPYGLGIIEVEEETAAHAIMADDPTTRSGLPFTFEITPMRIGMIRK